MLACNGRSRPRRRSLAGRLRKPPSTVTAWLSFIRSVPSRWRIWRIYSGSLRLGEVARASNCGAILKTEPHNEVL
jgi:hypothetical protein